MTHLAYLNWEEQLLWNFDLRINFLTQVSGNDETSDTDTTQTLQQIQNNVDNWDQDEENNEIDNTPRESNNDEETST